MERTITLIIGLLIATIAAAMLLLIVRQALDAQDPEPVDVTSEGRGLFAGCGNTTRVCADDGVTLTSFRRCDVPPGAAILCEGECPCG